MGPDSKYDMLEVTDERKALLNGKAVEDIESAARLYFLARKSPLSLAWCDLDANGFRYPVRCALSQVVQDRFDYKDRETGEIEPATFDIKFQILAERRSDRIHFTVWCVIPVAQSSNGDLIKGNFQKALAALESFAACPCKPAKPCSVHTYQWMESVYGSYQVP